jgi:hypothetical protein
VEVRGVGEGRGGGWDGRGEARRKEVGGRRKE